MSSTRLFLLCLSLCGSLFSTLPARAGNLSLAAPGGHFSVPVTSFAEMRFFGVVKQQFDFSCGSAAVATLLTYHYDQHTDEQAVFQAMMERGDPAKIKSQGFSLLDMKQYIEAKGLRADGFRLPLERLQQAGLPAIGLIDAGGYRHFVVIKGLQDDQVLVGDPALGLRAMPRAEFEQSWNGILFVIHGGKAPPKNAFNRRSEWTARPPAPLSEAISRADLATFTLAHARRDL
jgi:predicted double-glycine peptidase